MTDNLLAEVVGKLAVLERRVDMQEKLLHILMLLVPADSRDDLQNLILSYQKEASAMGNDNLAKDIENINSEITSLGDPKKAAGQILLQAWLMQPVPQDRKEAMTTWLTNATDEEIADEIALRLQQSLPQSERDAAPDDLDGPKDDK